MKKYKVIALFLAIVLSLYFGRHILLWYNNFNGPVYKVPAFDFDKMGVSELQMTKKLYYSDGLDTVCLELVKSDKSISREIHRLSGVSPGWQKFEMQMKSRDNDAVQAELSFYYVYTQLDTLGCLLPCSKYSKNLGIASTVATNKLYAKIESAKKQGQKIITKEVKNKAYTGKVMMYNIDFLTKYFTKPQQPSVKTPDEDDLPF